ncbi:DUF4369 domain-containing protein [Marinifilum caeruleilacunae]|uniref:DUF4369 domain-containing protein n=1 Tax=Marinifilum caeruleilacunae TaxID=2499076 RepID=A0ABX1X1B0_9BACT|nr:DUF4369 domain-containing protein [Marinifilum caeruleilacunae]NOU62072.1 DUF4369 domain-containing protein [Marinifilum caeruleilacunae]
MNYRTVLLLIFVISMAVSCKNTKKDKAPKGEFVLTGTIEGLPSGKVYLLNKATQWKDSVLVTNGSFTYKGSFVEPTMLALMGEQGYMTQFFAENAKITVTGKFGDMTSFKAVGGKANTDKAICDEAIQQMQKEQNFSRNVMMELYNPATTDARRKEVEAIMAKIEDERNKIEMDFIKNHPASYYSLYLVWVKSHGSSTSEMKEWLALLDASLKNSTTYNEMIAQLKKMEKTEVSLEDFVKEASNVSYKVDDQYKGTTLKNVVYLGMFSNNNLCALQSDGTILSVNPKGEKVSEFKAGIKGQAASIAIDKNDNIYVMDVQQEMVKKKVRGRVHSYPNPIGVECTVYNSKGEKQRAFKCEENITASGARVLEGKLLVSDNRGGMIGIYDAQTGKIISKIPEMRPCCGILDFSVNKKNQLVVANLGAFRIQSFDLSGKSLMEFGKRGKSLEDFHGCCNPVSVASLNNGALVTVEKDPTRVKVFSKEGAKQIEGIQELVKGCSYIPMIVDGNDNLYLASGEKGLVKCVVKS